MKVPYMSKAVLVSQAQNWMKKKKTPALFSDHDTLFLFHCSRLGAVISYKLVLGQ